jgi:hypothetical protein
MKVSRSRSLYVTRLYSYNTPEKAKLQKQRTAWWLPGIQGTELALKEKNEGVLRQGNCPSL